MLEILPRRRDPVEEGTPRRLGLMLVEALEHHRNRQNAARGEDKLLAPVWIEERLRVKLDRLANEPAIGVVGGRLDRREHDAERLRKLVRAQRDAGDDAEPAAAPFERPEEVGIYAGVGDSDLAVRGDDLRLDKVGAGRSVGLREAAEAAAEDEPDDADRHAAAALHVATALRRHLHRRPGASMRPPLSTRPAAAPRGPRSRRRRKRRAASPRSCGASRSIGSWPRWMFPGSCGRRP